MGEIITTVTIVILLIIAVCFIGSLVLAKDTKKIPYTLWDFERI